MHKICKYKIYFVLIILLTGGLRAQETSDGIILIIPASARMNAMGGIGVALSIPDPFLQQNNPAQLGMLARMSNFGLHFYPGALQLTNTARAELKTSAVSLGYQAGGRERERGFGLGIGYVNADLDLGSQFADDPISGRRVGWVSNESIYSISAGLSFEYFAMISLGMTYKWINLNPGLVSLPDDRLISAQDNTGALDYGIILTLPVHEFFFKKGKSVDPFIDFSLGYSRANLGDEIRYNDQVPARPLPRMARLGYAVKAGINMDFRKRQMNALTAYWSVEANDLLVTEQDNGFKYQGFFGDINIGSHIIRMTGDEKVLARVGYGLELFDTFFVGAGYYSGREYDRTNTYGYGIRTKGVFRMLSRKYTKDMFSFIFENIDIQYYYSKYAVIPGEDIRYHGIIISMSGI